MCVVTRWQCLSCLNFSVKRGETPDVLLLLASDIHGLLPLNAQEFYMKIHRLLVFAPLMFGLAPSASFADCNPACRGQKVCRYDSTRNPQFYCHKPPAGAASAAPSPRAPDAPKAAYKWEGPDFDVTKSAKSTTTSSASSPKRAPDPNAQYNPKEVGVDKTKH